MTTRITLRLPDAVYERAVSASARSGRSLNQVIVDALWETQFESKRYEDMTPQERMNRKLREAGRPYTEEELADLQWGDDEEIPDLSHEELWDMMPKLPPEKWLSTAIIDDREDRV